MEATLTQPRTYLEIQLNSGEITKNKQMNKSKRKDQNLVHMEEPAPTQPAHTCTTENKRWERDSPSDNQLVGNTQQQPKTKDIHRANINHSPRSVSSGDQGDCPTESHRYSTTEVYTINPGGQNRLI